jgi:hypothetical protein
MLRSTAVVFMKCPGRVMPVQIQVQVDCGLRSIFSPPLSLEKLLRDEYALLTCMFALLTNIRF